MNCTIYLDYQSSEGFVIPVMQALNRIKDGASKELISAVRNGKEMKKKLPCVVFSGVVEGRRCDANVVEHSGYFILDFDNVDTVTVRNQLLLDDYVYAVWLSPSGNGVKALVRCTPDIHLHDKLYTTFCVRYPNLDTSSKNISRLCFESHDVDIVIKDNCKTWTETNTEIKSLKDLHKERKVNHILAVAISMIRMANDNEKHDRLLDASNLLGGYIATGAITESEAINVLETEIRMRDIKDFNGAAKTIRDGIEHGKSRPIYELKKQEKKFEFIKQGNGEFEFIADDTEMDRYEDSVISGTLPIGLTSNIPTLDMYWMFKYNSLDWFIGLDNVGKTSLLWYFTVLTAMFHKLKVVIFSPENSNGELRKKLKEFYIGKPITQMSHNELMLAQKFIKDHYRIFSNKFFYSFDDLLLRFEVVYDEGFEYDLAVAEPFNAMKQQSDNMHSNNLEVLNKLRVFKDNYSTLWIADHISSPAARKRNNDGFIETPYKTDVDGGAVKASKADNFIVVHRHNNDKVRKSTTELHVQKIRSTETGGDTTDIDDPVKFIMHPNKCGYSVDGVDPIFLYWERIGN